MMSDERKTPDTLLGSFRVLDLTDEKGFLCGKILGDLGADVIKIEPPRGDPSRNIGPFFNDDPDPEKSLYWFALNNNKRGITLNLESPDGRELLRNLVKGADFLIESFAPGYLDGLGLSYNDLSKVNSSLIMTSITPFGETGPFRDYRSSDIVAMAMGGMMYLCGDTDRPPVRISFPQSYFVAGLQAALGTMIAYYHREVNGEGQHVDVSIQESVSLMLLTAPVFWDLNRVNMRRSGPFRVGTGSEETKQRLIWPCKDGQVMFIMYGGSAGRVMNALVEWMDSEGLAPDFMKGRDWRTFDHAKAIQEDFDSIYEPLSRFFHSHTKAELFDGAVRRDILFYPVFDMKDIVEDPQLSARGFWQDVNHEGLQTTITYPRCFAHFLEKPCSIRRRAPHIGEHNLEIYEGELGLSRGELLVLKQGGII